jgi:ArsR family transcriptional regulator
LSILIVVDTMRRNMARGKAQPTDPDVAFFAALADSTRLAIVRELAGAGTECACDFTSCCDVRQPTVSHHLRVLREAGVIESERRGTWIYYRLTPAAAERLRAFAAELEGGSQLIPASSLARSAPSASTSSTAQA